MKFMLTGATGYLGSRLVDTLVGKGHQLVILKRDQSDTCRIDNWLEKIQCFDTSCSGIDRAFERHAPFDAVIHTATCYGRKGEPPSELLSTNLTFPLSILEYVADGGAKAFVNTDTPLPRDLNAYALSKKQFVEWGQVLSGQSNFKWINVVLEHFYGPGDDGSKLITWLVRSCLGNVPELPMTKGEQLRDFVHIDDVVRAYEAILEHKHTSSAEYYVGSGQGLEIRQVANLVKRLCNSKSELVYGAIPYRANEVMESTSDLKKIRQLGWSPNISFVDGLSNLIAFEKEGYCR